MPEVTHSFSDLKVVNAKCNLLPYRSEVEEDWTPIDVAGEGDCDSYATAKLQRLVQYGWPVEALRLACVFVEPSAAQEKANRYHLVLLADFGGVTYVLDNLHPYPTRHDLLGYEWHKMWNHEQQRWMYANGADRSFE